MSIERNNIVDWGSLKFENKSIEHICLTLEENPLWYLDQTILKLINEYFIDKQEEKDDEWFRQKLKFISFISELLSKNRVYLGVDRGEGYNDDDKALFHEGKVEWVKKPDTVVIHHTATPQNTPYHILNAWHLLRLYMPLYIGRSPHFYGSDTNPLPVESGHFFETQEILRHQTFIGYTHIVWQDGQSIQPLKDQYMGFHSGDLTTNKRSIGIAIVGDLSESTPSDAAIFEVARIIKLKQKSGILPEDFRLIGHKDVQKPDGSFIDTICPGSKWEEWKVRLQALIQ